MPPICRSPRSHLGSYPEPADPMFQRSIIDPLSSPQPPLRPWSANSRSLTSGSERSDCWLAPRLSRRARTPEINCEPITTASGPRPRAWPTLALTLRICQLNRQSSASARSSNCVLPTMARVCTTASAHGSSQVESAPVGDKGALLWLHRLCRVRRQLHRRVRLRAGSLSPVISRSDSCSGTTSSAGGLNHPVGVRPAHPVGGQPDSEPAHTTRGGRHGHHHRHHQPNSSPARAHDQGR